MFNPDPKDTAAPEVTAQAQEVDKLVCSAEFPEGCKPNLSPDEA